MPIEVTRAHFYAKASRGIYVKLLTEGQPAGEEQNCGKLKKAMYDTRDAAHNWQNTSSETVREIGFVVGEGSPCHFHNQECGCVGRMVHGDCFVFVGASKYLAKLAKRSSRSTWRGSSASMQP